MTTETLGPTETGRIIAPVASHAPRVVAYLPTGETRSAALLETLDVGRAASNGLALRGDGRASGRHAQFRREGGRTRVSDRGSRNGLFVDGERVAEAPLSHGSVIRCGDSVLVFEDAPASAPDTTAQSRATAALDRRVRELAETARSVLILGPTGAGKGHLVGRIHAPLGASVPLVSLNCAAIPKALVASELFGHARGAFSGAHRDKRGILEAGAGGIVFLDEIGELAPDVQAQLLHVVETGRYRRVGEAHERTVRTRWIAATNVDIEAQIAAGGFRQDLYYRLAQEVVTLTGLSDRRVDIVPLFVQALGVPDHHVLSPEALEALLRWRWPGNVRELLNVAGGLGGERIDFDQLPAPMTDFLRAATRTRTARHQRTKRAEPAPPSPANPPPKSTAPPRAELERQLQEAGGNVSALARRLGQHRNQVVRWLDYYGLR